MVELPPLLLNSTINLITYHKKKDKDQEVNAAFKVFLGKMNDKQTPANRDEDLDDALSKRNQIMEMMAEASKIATAKQVIKLKENFQKKSSGRAENQVPSSIKRDAGQSRALEARYSKQLDM